MNEGKLAEVTKMALMGIGIIRYLNSTITKITRLRLSIVNIYQFEKIPFVSLTSICCSQDKVFPNLEDYGMLLSESC